MPILFLIVLIDLIGFGIIIPLLPFYAEAHGAEPHTVGLLMASYSLFQLFAAPLWGRLSDRVGRRPVLILGMAGAAVSYVMLASADTLWALFAARALGGAMAGNISAAFAYAADITTTENRAKGMGVVGAAFGLGFVLGPALGGLLAGPDAATANYAAPAWAAAGMSAVALVLTVVRLPESLPPEKRGALRDGTIAAALAMIVRRPPLLMLFAVSFLTTFVFAGMEATFALWSERSFGWGPAQNGFAFAYLGVLVALLQGGATGFLVARFGEVRLMTAGILTLSLGIFGIPFAPGIVGLIVVLAAVAAGFSIVNPALNALISRQAGESEQGTVMGLARSATILARVAGPAWAGLLFSVLGKDWPFIAGAVVMLLAVPLGFYAARRAAG